jgi:hypothetical protein
MRSSRRAGPEGHGLNGRGSKDAVGFSPPFPKEALVTLVWFVIWLVCNVIGDNEPLVLDPVNWWLGTLILAVALDLGAQHATTRR